MDSSASKKSHINSDTSTTCKETTPINSPHPTNTKSSNGATSYACNDSCAGPDTVKNETESSDSLAPQHAYNTRRRTRCGQEQSDSSSIRQQQSRAVTRTARAKKTDNTREEEVKVVGIQVEEISVEKKEEDVNQQDNRKQDVETKVDSVMEDMTDNDKKREESEVLDTTGDDVVMNAPAHTGVQEVCVDGNTPPANNSSSVFEMSASAVHVADSTCQQDPIAGVEEVIMTSLQHLSDHNYQRQEKEKEDINKQERQEEEKQEEVSVNVLDDNSGCCGNTVKNQDMSTELRHEDNILSTRVLEPLSEQMGTNIDTRQDKGKEEMAVCDLQDHSTSSVAVDTPLDTNKVLGVSLSQPPTSGEHNSRPQPVMSTACKRKPPAAALPPLPMQAHLVTAPRTKSKRELLK